MYHKFLFFTSDLIINHYDESIKQFLINESEYYMECLRNFNNEKHLYHHRKHKINYLEQQIITSDKEHRDFVIRSIGAQLHFTDLYKTLDPDAGYILTYQCGYQTHKSGHAFNILYNTTNSKICIIDYDMLPYIIGYINLHGYISQIIGEFDNIISLMYSEPGFWENTAFEKTDMFKTLNIYDSNPVLKYFSSNYISINDDDSFSLNIESGQTAINMYNTKKDINNPYVNLVSFGCATLNETEKSLEMLLTSYNTILYYNNIDTSFDIGTIVTKLGSFYTSFMDYIKNRNRAPAEISNVAQSNHTSKKKHKKSKSMRRRR